MGFQKLMVALGLLALLGSQASADINNWQTGLVIPGTEGITPAPGVDLAGWNSDPHNLKYGDFRTFDLTGAAFDNSWLNSAYFQSANLTSATMTSAALNSANMTGANLAGADLTNAISLYATMTDAVLTDAMVKGASFSATTGFVKEQLYSTGSYKNGDISGIRLAYNTMTGWDFSNQNMAGAYLKGSTLSSANLTGADLTSADVSYAYLLSTTLTNATMAGATLTSSTLTSATFDGANLAGADLSGATLKGTNLTNANLRGADLTNVTYTTTAPTLTGADLTDAVIKGAWVPGISEGQLYSTTSYKNKDLSGVRLGNVGGWDLSGQNLIGARLTTMTGTNLAGANLTDAYLYSRKIDSANLAGANLTNANLGSADLTGTNAAGANLTNANLGSANLTNAILTGADLHNAKLTGSNMANADITDANIAGADFGTSTTNDANNFTQAQVLSTASYKNKNLSGVKTLADLSGADFTGFDLTGSNLANVTGANLTDAQVKGATLKVSKDQLYSTGSYKGKDLTGVVFANSVTDWNFSGLNLTSAGFHDIIVKGAVFTDAVIKGADFSYSSNGYALTKEQLYTTATYKNKDMSGIKLIYNYVQNWDLTGQNLTGVVFQFARLDGTTFADATINGASFYGAIGFEAAQIYSTASYKNKDLAGVNLAADVEGWDFTDQNITAATFGSFLSGTDFSRADLRGATVSTSPLGSAITQNTIRPDGTIRGLSLQAGQTMIVRDYPLAVTVNTQMAVPDGATLRMVMGDGTFGSTVQMGSGVVPQLGGTLDLLLGDGVVPGPLLGKTFHLFNWNQTLAGDNVFDAITTAPGYSWDTSDLYVGGTVTLLTPEPGTMGMLLLGAVALLPRRHFALG